MLPFFFVSMNVSSAPYYPQRTTLSMAMPPAISNPHSGGARRGAGILPAGWGGFQPPIPGLEAP
jgi:hypothetical protein